MALTITKKKAASGMWFWEVSGDTFSVKDMLRKAGGKWSGRKKAWLFFRDPPGHIYSYAAMDDKWRGVDVEHATKVLAPPEGIFGPPEQKTEPPPQGENPWEMSREYFYSEERERTGAIHPEGLGGTLPTKKAPFFEKAPYGDGWRVVDPYEPDPAKRERTYRTAGLAQRDYDRIHKEYVRKALAEGKNVPASVMKEYAEVMAEEPAVRPPFFPYNAQPPDWLKARGIDIGTKVKDRNTGKTGTVEGLWLRDVPAIGGDTLGATIRLPDGEIFDVGLQYPDGKIPEQLRIIPVSGGLPTAITKEPRKTAWFGQKPLEKEWTVPLPPPPLDHITYPRTGWYSFRKDTFPNKEHFFWPEPTLIAYINRVEPANDKIVLQVIGHWMEVPLTLPQYEMNVIGPIPEPVYTEPRITGLMHKFITDIIRASPRGITKKRWDWAFRQHLPLGDRFQEVFKQWEDQEKIKRTAEGLYIVPGKLIQAAPVEVPQPGKQFPPGIESMPEILQRQVMRVLDTWLKETGGGRPKSDDVLYSALRFRYRITDIPRKNFDRLTASLASQRLLRSRGNKVYDVTEEGRKALGIARERKLIG